MPLNWAAAGHRIARYAPPGEDRRSSSELSPLGMFEGKSLDSGPGEYTHGGPQGLGPRQGFVVPPHPVQLRGSLLSRGLSPFSRS